MSYYTISHRKKGERRTYRTGYRTEDMNILHNIAVEELNSGLYTSIYIIDADTNKKVATYRKGGRTHE